MHDFIDSLNVFLIREYNMALVFANSDTSVILCIPSGSKGGWSSSHQYLEAQDREDFEEYILEYVSKCLNVKIEKI